MLHLRSWTFSGLLELEKKWQQLATGYHLVRNYQTYSAIYHERGMEDGYDFMGDNGRHQQEQGGTASAAMDKKANMQTFG